MQGVHELGHVLAAVVSKGHVQCVVWSALAISRTDVVPNPHPLFVCWTGPVVGCLVPVVCASLARQWAADKRKLEIVVLWFFSGFCCVANGAYVSIGTIDRIGDAGVLLKNGSPEWLQWSVGMFAIVAGFAIWHGLGSLSDLHRLRVKRSDLVKQGILLLFTLLLQAVVSSEFGQAG